MLKRNRIFIKIFKIIFFIILSFSIGLFIYSVFSQKSEVLKSLNKEANGIVKILLQVSADSIVLNDGSSLVEFYLKFLEENKLVKSVILSKKNNNYYILKKDAWQYEDKLDKVFLDEQKHNISSKIMYSPLLKEDVYHYTYPIVFTKTNWGWIHLSISLEEYYKKLTAMYIKFIVFFIIILIVTFIISYLIAKRFSNPIIKLNQVTKEISQGNLKLRSFYKSDDEIGELSETFNEMVSTIEENQRKLREINQELEQRVTQRTHELHSTNKELEKLNKNLDNQVKKEVEKRMDKEAMLVQQSKLASMGEMLGNISHQWRQPLSVISVAATGMKTQKEYGLSDENIELEKLELIMKTTKYLSQTIEDFRNFFKPDKEKIIFSLKNVVEQSLDLINTNFIQHSIEVEKSYIEDSLVFGYEGECCQAVINILSNARDVILERKVQAPKVFIREFKKSEYCFLEIEDNAGGIDKKIIDSVFEPYFTTKEKRQGTGIGLYMSKTIIEKNMNGKLEVRNGEFGAIFSLAVPLKEV